MGLTEPQKRTLLILVDQCPADLPGGLRRSTNPAAVARALWPDSPGWNKRSQRGWVNGAMGATMPMKAAQILWRLSRLNLAYQDHDTYQWRPTVKGVTTASLLTREDTV